jgi:hypothetical protein
VDAGTAYSNPVVRHIAANSGEFQNGNFITQPERDAPRYGRSG